MSDKLLHLGYGFSLPADQFIETKFGVLGQSGRGKTGFVRRTLEECHRVGLPFIVMDPSGILWGLRSSFDGKGPGLPILVIGGEHGDYPLVRTAGAEVARAVVEANISCVIDLSQESKATYRTFAKDFAETLFAINDSPRFLVLDEAPELVPESLSGRPDLAATFDAVERLVRQGRNKGIGVMLVSQRAATISKDVLTQCGTLVIFGLVGTPDRIALKKWVEAYGSEAKLKEFEQGLATLEVRECYVWSPSEFKVFEKIRVLDFHTFHPDRTHLRRIGMLKQKAVTTDVSQIVKKLGVKMERIAKDKADVAQVPRLKSELARLTAELDRTKNAPRAATPAKPDPKALQEAYERGGREIAAKYKTSLAEYAKVQTKITGATSALVRAVDELPKLTIVHPPWQLEQDRDGRMAVRVLDVPEPARAPRSVTPAHVDESMPETGDGSEKKLYSGAIRILVAFAQHHPLGLTYGQAATLTGFAPRGHTFKTYTAILKRHALIEHGADGTMRVTAAGLAEAGEVPAAPQTHGEVMALWQKNLYSGAYKILESIVERYPGEVDVETIAAETGFAAGGHTLKTYLSILQRNLLITREGHSYKASSSLYPE